MRSIKQHATPSMVVAVIALIVALSGSAVAAKSLIDGRDIRRRSIPADRLTAAAVRSLKGAKGDTGARGVTGATGATGAQGAAGAAGERGERGERGEQGERGERGEQGPAGPQGEAGADGEDAGVEIAQQLTLDGPLTIAPEQTLDLPADPPRWTQESNQVNMVFARFEFSERPTQCSPNEMGLYSWVVIDGQRGFGAPVNSPTYHPGPGPWSVEGNYTLPMVETATEHTLSIRLESLCEGDGESFTLSNARVRIVAIG